MNLIKQIVKEFEFLPNDKEHTKLKQDLLEEVCYNGGGHEDLSAALDKAAELTKYRNDELAKEAREKGLDEYDVLERASIHEFEGGLPRWQADQLALGKSIYYGEE